MKKPEMSNIVNERLSKFAEDHKTTVEALNVKWDYFFACWTFEHDGIFYGAELDGYLHS